MHLLTLNNYKTNKSVDLGYSTAILHLAPAKLSGHNVCTSASKGCIKACLNKSGHGQSERVQRVRKRRTKLFFEQKDVFLYLLQSDIQTHIRRSRRSGLEPCIRLNGTSDLKWEEIFPELFQEFSDINFYDYTKHFSRMLDFIKGKLPDNYHLTFSRSENNDEKCLKILRQKGNVAVVFNQIPKKWKRFKVFDADQHDLRFLDPRGVAGLSPKAKAKKDKTGFVQ